MEPWARQRGSNEEWDEEIQNYLRQCVNPIPFEEYKRSFTSFSGVLSPALRQNLEGLFTNLYECAGAAGLKVNNYMSGVKEIFNTERRLLARMGSRTLGKLSASQRKGCTIKAP